MGLDKRNIILITVDCLRRDYFTELISQENNEINNLLRPIDNFISAGSNTPISFEIIMTGRYSSTLDKELGLEKEKNILATELKKIGYRTIGIIEENPALSGLYNYSKEIDFFLPLEPEKIKKKSLLKIIKNILLFPIPRRRWKELLPLYLASKFDYRKLDLNRSKKEAHFISFKEIKQAAERAFGNFSGSSSPLFFWFHCMDPHFPYFPFQGLKYVKDWKRIEFFYYLQRKRKKVDKHNNYFNKEIVNKALECYKNSIKKAIEKISALLRFLKNRGIINKNSLIILTADHGEAFGEHGFFEHNFGIEKELYEIPFFISKNINLEFSKDLLLSQKFLYNIILDFA